MKKLNAFTLAEVLITLAIIGVVAALTIPSVITNYRKNLYVTQLKKEYNYFTNAFHTAMANDGVTKLSDTKLFSGITTVNGPAPWNPNINIISTSLTSDNILDSERSISKEEFLKIFNVIQIYDGNTNKLPIEGNQIAYKKLNGQAAPTSGEGYSIFKDLVCLADGACFKFNFNKTPGNVRCGSGYYDNCTSLSEFQEVKNTPTKLWQSIGSVYIDVNGFQKGPNQTGRDYFWFDIGNDGILYPAYGADKAVYNGSTYTSVIENTTYSYWKYDNNKACNPSEDNIGWGCAARIMEEGWKMNY